MKMILMLITFVVGIVLSLHLVMNSQISKIINDLRLGNVLFWIIGTVTTVIIAMSNVTNINMKLLKKLGDVPLWLYLAGVIGATFIVYISFIIPKLGANITFIALLSGQIVGGLLIAHFGVLDTPMEKVNLIKIFGLIMMICGAILAVSGELPFLGKKAL